MKAEKRNFICIICPSGCNIEAEVEGKKIISMSGYKCPKGEKFLTEEIVEPKRVLTTTVKLKNGEVKLLPVKTSKPVPKELIPEIMKLARSVTVEAPVKMHDVILKDLFSTGADLLATRSAKRK